MILMARQREPYLRVRKSIRIHKFDTKNVLRAFLLQDIFFVVSSKSFALLTQAEGFDDGAVAFDVLVLEILEQSATLTYQFYEGPFCSMIFTVGLHVFRQVGNTVRKQGYLALARTSIRIRLSVLAKDLFFLFRI